MFGALPLLFILGAALKRALDFAVRLAGLGLLLRLLPRLTHPLSARRA